MRRTRFAGLVSALALAMSVGLGGTASADGTVRGCAQSWSDKPGTCIEVVTGAKNSSNHTQWVSKITVRAPRAASAPSQIEAWAGDGPTGIAWYKSTPSSLLVTWSINKWIKNRSGICGSYKWRDGSGRSIACITIKA